MKAAILTYHKNLSLLYPQQWTSEYKQSILNQTRSDLPIFEMDYGAGAERIFKKSLFESAEYPSFVFALNYLLDKVFSGGYDYVLNSNVDDKYSGIWVEKTLQAIMQGYDLVSCNFHLFDERGVYHSHEFADLDIQKELDIDHNIICHPGVCYSRKFWERGNRYIPGELPYEDLRLWQRAIKNSKFYILPQHLVYHRVHDNSVCNSENR